MVSKAYARFIRVSPRKMRQVADVIRGKSVYEAISVLTNLNKRSAELAEEVVRSAMSNAKRNPDIKDERLYISRIMVDGGPMLKRFRAMSMGRAGMIRHRTSHITVELDLIPTKSAAAKPEKPKRKKLRK